MNVGRERGSCDGSLFQFVIQDRAGMYRNKMVHIGV